MKRGQAETEYNSGNKELAHHIKTSALGDIEDARAERERTGGVSYIAPEVLNPDDPEQARKIEIAKREKKEFHQLPIDAAVNEYLELQEKYQKILAAIGLSEQASGEEMEAAIQKFLKSLFVQTKSESDESVNEQEVTKLLSRTTLVKDLVAFIKLIFEFQGTRNELTMQQLHVIWNEPEKDLTYYVSERLIETLNLSRMLGLIPFEAIEKLRQAKIVVFGASVAASIVDLLVALGAKNIEFIDDGIFEPSNSQKMPAGPTADFRSNGESKAFCVAKSAHQRNPFGRFIPHKGRLVFSESDKREGKDDKLFSELTTGETTLVIEVVDDARVKIKVREAMAEHFSDIPLVFPADVGTNAFSGLDNSAGGKPFNQTLTPDQQLFLKKIAQEGPASPLEQIKAILLMVNDQLPDDHKLQVLLVLAGFIPWLSQTGIAAKQSAAIAAIETLWYFIDGSGVGINHTPQSAPKSLQPALTQDEKVTLDKLFSPIIN